MVIVCDASYEYASIVVNSLTAICLHLLRHMQLLGEDTTQNVSNQPAFSRHNWCFKEN